MTVLAQTENPQALAQTGGTPRGGCAAGLPAVAGQPSLICVPAAHLSSWPCWAHSHSEQLGRRRPHSQLQSWESSPTTSPWQPQPREARPPLTQMKAGHKCQQPQQPPLPPCLVSFLKSQWCVIQILHLRTPSQPSKDQESNVGKSELKIHWCVHLHNLTEPKPNLS